MEGRGELQLNNLSFLLTYNSLLTITATVLKLFSLKLAQSSLPSPWVFESPPVRLPVAHDSLHFISLNFCIIAFFRTSHRPLLCIPWSSFTWPSSFAPLMFLFSRDSVLTSLFFKHYPEAFLFSHSLINHLYFGNLLSKSINCISCFALSTELQTCVPIAIWIAQGYLAWKSLN